MVERVAVVDAVVYHPDSPSCREMAVSCKLSLEFPWMKRISSPSCTPLLTVNAKPGFLAFTQNDSKDHTRASLVAQWLRICLLMQGTRVQALVWEGPTCRGATGPVSHNY